MIHVVLGGKSNALAIIRSLSDLDGEFHVLTTTPSSICRYSKFVDSFRFFDCSSKVLEELSEYDVNSKKILYPTSDLWASFVSYNAAYLKSRGFIFLTIPYNNMAMVLDKFLLYQEFKDKLLMPETVLGSCKSQLKEDKDVIIKPRQSFSGDVAIEKGFRERLDASSDLIVQQKLSMDLRNHYSLSGIAIEGRIIFGGLTNKVLEHPSPGGTATLVCSSKIDQSLRDKAFLIAEHVISAIEYDGVFEIELIQQGGEFWFLELNPRFWLQHQIFSLINVNIASIYMNLCLGNPVEKLENNKCEDLVWLHEGVVISLFTSRYPFFEVVRALLCGRKIMAHWCFSDPKPFFRFLFEMLCKRK